MKDLIATARAARSPEELISMAQASGMGLEAEQAAQIFQQLHGESAELSDEELDNVAGGGCNDDYPVNLPYCCSSCGKHYNWLVKQGNPPATQICPDCGGVMHRA